jgi:hypothetical protein
LTDFKKFETLKIIIIKISKGRAINISKMLKYQLFKDKNVVSISKTSYLSTNAGKIVLSTKNKE